MRQLGRAAVDTKITDPTEDPKLPSFHRPALVGLSGNLQVAHDCWTFLRGVEKEYLKQEPEEPADAYGARIAIKYSEYCFGLGLDDELVFERQSQLPAQVVNPKILALLPY